MVITQGLCGNKLKVRLCKNATINNIQSMIYVQVKENEPLERALKRFKKKVERVKILKEIKERRYYTKPSIKRKEAKTKAVYRQRMKQQEMS